VVTGPDGFAVLLLDPVGRVVGWNAGAQRMKGYAASEILGRSFEVFYPPEEAEKGEPARHLAEATAAGHVEYQGWRVRKDGSRFWADVVLTAVFDDDGGLRGFGKVAREATARHEAEQALRDSQQRFRLLADSARNFAIVMLDPAGLVVGWDPSAERMKGYSAAQILGRSFSLFYPPEEAEGGEPARHLAEATAAGHVEYQGWRVRRDGSRFWADVVLTAVFDDVGGLRGFGKVTRDSTTLRQADQALRDSEEHFRVLVDSVRDYAIMMLDPAGLVVSWNAGAEQIHGYRPPEILGRSFDVFYPPEEAEAGEPARHLAEAIAAGTRRLPGLAGPQGRLALLGRRGADRRLRRGTGCGGSARSAGTSASAGSSKPAGAPGAARPLDRPGQPDPARATPRARAGPAVPTPRHGRGALPGPGPFQADQRQPGTRGRRRAAHPDRGAAARSGAPA
jgi:PAS domain S-box-containing protein